MMPPRRDSSDLVGYSGGDDHSPHLGSQTSFQSQPSPSAPRHRGSHSTEESTRASPGDMSTPLLMPPPPLTPLVWLRHRALLASDRAAHFLYRHGESIAFLIRLSLLLLKIASLARLCWPYTVKLGIGASLVAIAALDLGIPSIRASGPGFARANAAVAFPSRSSTSCLWNWKVSSALLVLHFATLWVTARRGALCALPMAGWATW